MSRIFHFLDILERHKSEDPITDHQKRHLTYELSTLESHLGKKLFIKNNKNYILTEFGEAFHSYAQDIADRTNRLLTPRPKAKEHLVIAAPPGASKKILPKILAKYIKLYGEMDFFIKTIKSFLIDLIGYE